MSDNVLDFLREQFARVNGKLDRLAGDVGNLKVRLSALEAEAGHVRVGLAEVNSRIDRMDTRRQRILVDSLSIALGSLSAVIGFRRRMRGPTTPTYRSVKQLDRKRSMLPKI